MTSLINKIEAELNKVETDRETWNTVNEFWTSNIEWPNHLLQITLDRVQLLEAKMEAQHGWKR